MKLYSNLDFQNMEILNPATYSTEEIAELFDLSEEEAVELTKVISNQVAINKVYSSQKTEERLTEILAEANEYATKLLGNANFLTVEIVTSESEVTSNNVLYLIADGQGTNTYNQFILVDEEVKSLGSTSIDLSNYHTKDEITTLLADYAKKNEILSSDNIVTTIDDTVTNTQVVGALTVKEELDKKVSKDNIVTTINDACTNEQISSAKAVNDLVLGLFASNYNYKNTSFLKNTFRNDEYSSTIYTDANELPVGLQSANNLINAPKSGHVYYLTLFFNGDSNFRVQLGIPIMSYDIHIRYMAGSAWSEWKKLALATG